VIRLCVAAVSGQMVKWDDTIASNLELAPGLDDFTLELEPPVKPDADDTYPVAMPGTIKIVQSYTFRTTRPETVLHPSVEGSPYGSEQGM
jgi:hypothetical protein